MDPSRDSRVYQVQFSGLVSKAEWGSICFPQESDIKWLLAAKCTRESDPDDVLLHRYHVIEEQEKMFAVEFHLSRFSLGTQYQ